MREVIVKNNKCEVGIKVFDEDMTWCEIMISVIDAIKGHGYLSEQLDGLYEEWFDKEHKH